MPPQKKPRFNNNHLAAAAHQAWKQFDWPSYYPALESAKPISSYLKDGIKKGLSAAVRMRFRRRYGSKRGRARKGRVRRSRGYYLKRRKNRWLYRVRPEIKKVEDTSNAASNFALYNTNNATSGHMLINSSNTGRSFIPRISVGSQANNRIGETVLMKTLHCRFRITTQPNYVGPLRVKIYIISRPTDTTVGNAIDSFLVGDPMLVPSVGIYSPMSSRNTRAYQQFKIHREVDVWIPEDNTAGVQPITVEKEINVDLRGKTLRFHPGASTDFEHGDLACVLLCSGGAYEASQQTGLVVAWSTTLYYVDP